MARKETRTGGRDATEAVIPGRYALSVGMPTKSTPDGFKWRQLTEIARLESGHTPSRLHPEFWGGDIPWIGIRDATANHGTTIIGTNQSITELGVENSSTRVLPTGTVCLSRTASVGYTIIMGVPMATSQDFINWVCGPELSPSYLRYLLMMEQESIRTFSYGTTHQTLYYPDAKAMHVCIPSRGEQDKITEILGALDEKIASNRLAAETSRNLAIAHFTCSHRAAHAIVTITGLIKGGDLVVGDGYRTKRAEHAEKGFRIIRVTDVVEGTISPAGPDKVAEEFTKAIGEKAGRSGDIVLTTKGTVGHVALTPELDEQVVYSPQVCYFRCTEDSRVDRFYLRYWFESAEFRNQADHRMNNTDMAPYISLADIRSLHLTIPEPDHMRATSDQLAALENTAQGFVRENASLARLRDTLLPHLMSGRLRVKDAEKQVEAVV